MLRINRVLLAIAVVLIAHGCSVAPEQDEISGTRPLIIFDDVEGVFEPARGIDRGGPDLVDGQPYQANGPFLVRMRDVPRSDQAIDAVGQVQFRGGGRMEAPLPDHVMDLLREEAMLLPPSAAIDDPTAGGSVAADAASGTAFDSIDYTECCGGGGNVPPDPEIAASNTHLIAVVNVAFEVYDTSGVSEKGPSTFSSFFAGVPNCSGVFDPNVNYDESADRFVMGIDANGTHYCIAVSQTNDPTGDWWAYSFPTTSGRRDFFDYPHLGVGDEAVFMGANIFGVRSFKEGRVWAIDKIALYAGNAPTVVTYSTGSESTPQPMIARGAPQGSWPAGGPHYIITDGPFNGRDYGVWSWNNPFGGGVPIDLGTVDLNAATGEAAGMPVDQPQSGGGTIQANDWRVQDAEYRDGYIWMSNAQSCNPGGTGTVNCARWAQIDPTGPSVAAAGVVGSPGEFRSFPDVAVDACGNMMMGYSKTSSSIFPGVYAVGRDNLGSIGNEITVQPGVINYTSFESTSPRRWGDYTEMTIAPDGSTFWYLGEYSKDTGTTNGRWGTYIGQFTFGCSGGGNRAPTAVISSALCTGLNCSFDGSGSSDPDGDLISYDWDFGDGNNDSGVSVNHSYTSEGAFTVTLTVSDGSLSGSATTTANPDDGTNNPPTVTITTSACSGLDCNFVASGSDTDGTIEATNWTFGDGGTASGASVSHTYTTADTYPVEVTVTDDGGATGSDSTSVTVTEPSEPTTMSVASIVVNTVNMGRGNKAGRAVVTIRDDQGNLVSGVTVEGTFTGSYDESTSAGTGGNGAATLETSGTARGGVSFTFCVDNVTGESLSYDDSANAQTCASF